MKKGQAVILGFGATLKGRERTSQYREAVEKGDAEPAPEKPSSSMWKNIEKK
ncbi:hypothetical protein F442_13706 [Phytophthora nicotianae P10297]|uniref:Uncharacterized protein n=3 Tax=Phytophthora nicotianae TaxID=4792 RepID=V9EQX5_PHYNI|nr:hypothetical protein F443_13869 [Phytophthora nicotianae P1569]ETO69539.1 hypothetical protein F444_13903 [Phytophthora nicotianae P1976]ETP38784.1 hypothetical protein F442_13706 [Phytophthora nicotianae P10297]